MAEAEKVLFSIEDGQKSSLGTRLEFGKPGNNPSQKVIPELGVSKEEGGFKAVGAFIWQGGNLSELWEFQRSTFQFILDNIDKVK